MKNYRGQILGLVLILVASSGCVPSSTLSKHPLEGKRVAVVSEIPDAPFADFDMTIFDRVGQDVPIANREPNPFANPAPNPFTNPDPNPGEIPSLVFEQLEERETPKPMSKVHVLMDSVLADYDMASHIIRSAHLRSASMMQFDAVENEEDADYILVIHVDDYGIGADSWQSTAYFEVMGNLKLVDRASGKTVWKGEVMDIVPLARALLTVGMPADGIETPAALSRVSVDEMADVLSSLSTYASIQLTEPFREAYFREQDRETVRLENRQVAQFTRSFLHNR